MGAGKFDLASILDSSADAVQHLGTSIQDMLQNQVEQSKTAEEKQQAILGSYDARGETALSANIRLTGILQEQTKKQSLYDSLYNGGGFTKLATAQARQYDAVMSEAQKTAADLAEKKSVGLLDDPLAYVYNAVLGIPEASQKLQGQVQQAAVLKQRLTDTADLMDRSAKVELDYKTTINQAAVDSLTSAAQSDITARAASAKLAALQSNAQSIAQVSSMLGQQVDMAYKAHSAINQDEQLALHRKSAAMEETRFEEWRKEKRDLAVTREQEVLFFNVGAASLGLPQVDSGTRLEMLKRVNPEGVVSAMKAGFVLSATGATGSLAGSPSSVDHLFNKTGAQVPALEENSRRVIVTAEADYKNAIKAGTDQEPRTPEERDKLLDKYVAIRMRSYNTSIDLDNMSNPTNPAPPAVMAQQAAVKETKLYKVVLAPLIAADALKESDPKLLFAAGMEAVAKGDMKFGEVISDLARYYQTAHALNLTQANYTKYSLVAPQTMTATMQVPTVGGRALRTMAGPLALASVVALEVPPAAAILGGVGAASFYVGGKLQEPYSLDLGSVDSWNRFAVKKQVAAAYGDN